MIDAPPPQRLEEKNIGKKAKILRGEHAGEIGTIASFKSSIYQIELIVKGKREIVDRMPTEILVESGEAWASAHIASLTSAGVAGELAKTTPEPLSDLEQLRRQVASLIKANADLDEKLVNVQSANATLSQQLEEEKRNRNNERQLRIQTLTEREKENEALKAELASARKTEVEALKMVEAERNEARRELEISRKQVQILAKKIRRDKKQQVEIKTLVHEFDAGENTSAIDAIFAEYKNEGWNVDHHTVNTVFDHTSRVTTHYRIVTLSRPVKTTPQPPKRTTATEAPIVVTGEVIPVSIPVPAYATPFNKAAMDAEVMANANAAVLAFRASRQNIPTPSFMLKSGV